MLRIEVNTACLDVEREGEFVCVFVHALSSLALIVGVGARQLYFSFVETSSQSSDFAICIMNLEPFYISHSKNEMCALSESVTFTFQM